MQSRDVLSFECDFSHLTMLLRYLCFVFQLCPCCYVLDILQFDYPIIYQLNIWVASRFQAVENKAAVNIHILVS